ASAARACWQTPEPVPRDERSSMRPPHALVRGPVSGPTAGPPRARGKARPVKHLSPQRSAGRARPSSPPAAAFDWSGLAGDDEEASPRAGSAPESLRVVREDQLRGGPADALAESLYVPPSSKQAYVHAHAAAAPPAAGGGLPASGAGSSGLRGGRRSSVDKSAGVSAAAVGDAAAVAASAAHAAGAVSALGSRRPFALGHAEESTSPDELDSDDDLLFGDEDHSTLARRSSHPDTGLPSRARAHGRSSAAGGSTAGVASRQGLGDAAARHAARQPPPAAGPRRGSSERPSAKATAKATAKALAKALGAAELVTQPAWKPPAAQEALPPSSDGPAPPSAAAASAAAAHP
ncbi:unnamed protein product, partial [Prorocentrum cordatum]